MAPWRLLLCGLEAAGGGGLSRSGTDAVLLGLSAKSVHIQFPTALGAEGLIWKPDYNLGIEHDHIGDCDGVRPLGEGCRIRVVACGSEP
jgi:hypothetical protein